MTVNFKKIRDSVSLQSFFEDSMGAKKKSVSGSMRYSSCPNCGTSSDLSVKCSVRNDKWHCFSCDVKGDIIDAASKFYGLPPAQAAMHLVNEDPTIKRKPANYVAEPRIVRNQEAITEVIARLLDAQRWPHQACVDYLSSRGISKEIILTGIAKKMIITLPGNPDVALDYLLDVVGGNLLNDAGMWKEDSKAPAILYKPLGFISPNRQSIEFRHIAEASSSMAKVIRYGEPTPWVWKGNRTFMIVEGCIDLLSALVLGTERTIIGLPGAKSWKESDEWLQGLKEKNVLLALDADEAGARGADDLQTILKSINAVSSRYKHLAGCTDLNDQLKKQLGLK